MKIVIASDHAGFELKEKIITYLNKKGFEITDFGCNSEVSVDYPDFAHPLAEAVSEGKYNFGIAICGTGNGMSMTINKHQNIRCALCWDDVVSYLARKHNDANVLCLPAWYTMDSYKKIIDTFINTEFEGGKHQNRVNKITIK